MEEHCMARALDPLFVYRGLEEDPTQMTTVPLMLNAHLPTGSRQLAISPTADWESAFVGRCVLNADPIVGANRRYSADSKFESA